MKIAVRSLVFIGFAALSVSAAVVGKFSYKGAPENFNRDTMRLNDTMIAMSEKVFVKNQFLSDSIPDTPSVFFIIDNSGSMKYYNGSNPITDSNGYRFKVTSAFIDSIYKKYPSAEVGFAVYDSTLDFATSQDTIMKMCPSPYNAASSGAYLPLLKLNQKYYHDSTGLQIAHKYLRDTLLSANRISGAQVGRYVDLQYNRHSPVTSATNTPTNINIGFAAAKSAMAKAIRPKQNRFVVFLSDGDATWPNNSNTRFNFVRGDSVPTTFTVFFTPTDTVPPRIDTMTTNIQKNGYSTSNPKSNYWPFLVTNFSSLMNFLMHNVYTSLYSQSLGAPVSLSIGTQTATGWASDSSFIFNTLFPLTGAVTPFNFRIDYQLTRNGVVIQDHVDTVNFNVKRTPGAFNDTSKYQVWTWNRSLIFRNKGVVIPAIDETMDSVELRFAFDPGSANYNYTNATVKLATVNTGDSESYALTRIGSTDTFSVKFKTTIGAATKGNRVLEHGPVFDTLVAIFKNNEPQSVRLPLDTLRVTCPIHTGPGNILLTVSSDTIQAGDTAAISGVVTTQRGDTLAWLGDSIHWNQALPQAPGDTLFGTLGRNTRITATQAWDAAGNHRVLLVIAAVTNPYQPGLVVRDTAKIVVLPRTSSGVKLSIERYADTALAGKNLLGSRPDFYFAAQKLAQIVMDSVTVQLNTYAIVRDRYGNYIKLTDTTTSWVSINPDTIAAVAAKLKDVAGVGVVSRANSMHLGSGRVVVSQPGCAPDTVLILLHFDGLREIALYNVISGKRVDTILMSTDQNLPLIAKGMWASAPGVWSNINVLWSLAPAPDSLHFSTPLPTTAFGNWVCYPLTPGHALLTIRSGNVSATIPVFITAGTLRRITLNLLTSPDSCFAGKPIKLVATIRDTVGLMPGTVVFPVKYHDYLTDPTSSYQPWLTINGAVDSLDRSYSETFRNGVDTLSMVLYYAPATPPDSHRVQLTLDTIFQASTVPFKLKPGPLDSLQIEDSAGNHLVDTIILNQLRTTAHLFGRGFDQYGNRIVPDAGSGLLLYQTHWNADSTLPAFDTTGPDAIFTASYTRKQETGTIHAKVDILNASVPVKILPAVPLLVSAVTRDLDENGLIDHIECTFDTALAIDAGGWQYFSVQEPAPFTRKWTVTGITATSDRTYTLSLAEMDSSNAQTGWKPTVSFSGNAESIDISMQAKDGCAPVVWRATRHAAGLDHHNDWVEVILSEPIVDKSNHASSFSIVTHPDATFYAWSREDSGFARRDALLSGITSFDNNQPANRLVFTMRNGANLTDTNYLNVQTPADGSHGGNITDASGNMPSLINHKVRVQVGGTSINYQITKNPSRGTTQHANNGQINLSDQGPQAVQWAQNGGGFTVHVQLPDSAKTITMQIYDVAGNIVNVAMKSTPDLVIPDFRDFYLYWNGTNQKNTIVAPGVYRCAVGFKYSSSSSRKEDKLLLKFGVKGGTQNVAGQ